ncbi:LCP family protein [Actinosynnema sp. NPDC047251]|uniref:protein kinase domain-containing protein n=1 Tax=Saccharothrix espanaensis TaxID=103731 RepID=UPI0018D4A519|nr:LCP family protein [Saccharothrix espanaensis]
MQTSHPQVPGYSIVDVVGRGGFGVVYRAVQVTVDREVAIKVDSRVVLDEDDRRRFLREARAAGRLSGHPHVVDLYDAGVLPDGRPYLVMELCTGGSLFDRLQDAGPLPVAEACALGVKIADALTAAHEVGVLHRDIKPANILVNRYSMYGLADFGLAALAEPGRESSASLTALTPAYAPPEAFRQEKPTAQADVYALAATLHALITGRPPRFPEAGVPSLPEIIRLHDEPVPALPGVPEAVTAVLLKALATDPAQRHASAADFRDALAAAALEADTATPATPAGTATPGTAATPAGADPAETADSAAGGDPAETTDSASAATVLVGPDDPGPTRSFGFGPRRDEEATLGRVIAPEPAADPPEEVTELVEGRRPRRWRTLGRGVVAAAAAVVLVAAGITWIVVSNLDGDVRQAGVLDVPNSPDATDGATDILLVGSDSRTDTNGTPLSDDVLRQLRTEQSPGSNTDTVLLVRVPDDGRRTVVVSIPRDVRVTMPAGGTGPLRKVFDSARTAPGREGDLAGRKALVQTVQELTGVRVDRFAEVNLHGFVLVSQAIGGVDVCLNAAVRDAGSGADFPAGHQSVSGADALSFLRQRNGLPRGELDHIARQQAFLGGLADKLLTARTLADPAAVADLVTALRKSMVIDESWDLLGFAAHLRDLTAADVRFGTIPVGTPVAAEDGVLPVDGQRVRTHVADLLTPPAEVATPATGRPDARCVN